MANVSSNAGGQNASCTPVKRSELRSLVGHIAVIRTPAGTFIGCVRRVGERFLLLRIFRGPGRRFVSIRIPLRTIAEAFRFPCTAASAGTGSGTGTKPKRRRCGCG